MKAIDARTLWSLPRLGEPALAPHGGAVTFSIARLDASGRRMHAHLYEATRGAGEPRRLTFADGRDSAPTYSPDGRMLAFLRRAQVKGSPTELFVIPVDGGEARRVLEWPVSIASPRFHPDGTRLIFASSPPRGARTIEEMRAALQARAERPANVRATEDRLYRYWNRWIHEGDRPHLYSVDLGSGAWVDLTPDSDRFFDLETGACEFDIAPDGASLLFPAMTTPAPYTSDLRTGIFRLELDREGARGAPVELTADMAGTFSRPRFTPDGARFVVGWRADTRFYADPVRLGLMPVSGATFTPLTPGWDRSAEGWIVAPDGQHAFLIAEEAHATAIFAVDLAQAATPRLVLGQGTASGLAAASDGALFFLWQDLAHAPEVALIDDPLAGSAPRRVTNQASRVLENVALGTIEEHWIPGAQGDDVGVLVVLPPGYDPARRWPLVHLVHGGPHGVFGDAWHWRWNAQVFAAMGMVTAMVNFHGSTGRGDAFCRSILGEHPDKPFADVMAATDALLARYAIDPERMAVAGGSYGGYLVTWITGHTQRFATAINHAGVADLMAQMGSDVTHGRIQAYGGDPWSNLPAIDRQSPARFTAEIATPTLVIHGAQDFRVPVGNALEIYGILRAKGVPARLVIFPDEGHWILEPANSLHWYSEVETWLARWLRTDLLG